MLLVGPFADRAPASMSGNELGVGGMLLPFGGLIGLGALQVSGLSLRRYGVVSVLLVVFGASLAFLLLAFTSPAVM